MAIIGVVSSTAQWFLAKALSMADAGAVLPMDFMRLVFVTIIGIALFGETPDLFTLVGAGLILVSTVYIARREAAGRAAARNEPAKPAPEPAE